MLWYIAIGSAIGGVSRYLVALETPWLTLLDAGHWTRAGAYAAASLLLSLLATAAGLALGGHRSPAGPSGT